MASVIVFTTDWCPACPEFKKALRSAGIAFTEKDGEGKLADDLGVGSVPAVFIRSGSDYIRVREPSPNCVRAALARHE